ncbi:probable terminal nucleotidyltransferase 4B at N-terminal half [Coccomyxa sp. Obi]|nr:probable terminal nucleotidyltransferase 4B at N-terminal half [Coccomyxa sp. Obi]
MGRQRWRRRNRSGQDRRISDDRARSAASLQPGHAGAFGTLPDPGQNTHAERSVGWGGMPLESDGHGPPRQTGAGDWAERRIRMDSGDAGGMEELQRAGSGQGSKRRALSEERHPSPTGHVAPDNFRVVTRASPEEEGELGNRRVVAAVAEAELGLDRACSKRARVATPSDQCVTLSVPLPKVNPESTARLHKEILEFIANVTPTWEESNLRDAALGRVQGACGMMQLYRVFPFGSKASGLELWNSDIDVVILGVMEPSRDNLGYTEEEKYPVNNLLSKVVSLLRASNSVRKAFHIRSARVPIIKCTTVEGVDIDVSVNGDRGIRAAQFLIDEQARRPALRPLTLLIKAMLKVLGLGDVSQGGLGSFSVANMVIAHLQEEEKAGRGQENLGVSLLAFLLRYGRYFNYDYHMVATGRGGIVSKSSVPGVELIHTHMGTRIFIEDADTLREIAGGTYYMDSVRETFRAAATILEPLLCRSDGQPSRAGPSILEQMFPVRKVLSRVPLLEDNHIAPALPPPILPNPLNPARQQPDGNTGKPLLTAADDRKTPPGETAKDWYSSYKQMQPASEPGTKVACTAVFLDPSYRKTMLEWARPKLSEVSADRLVLSSQPDIRHVAEAALGSSVELSVMGVADDDTVQILLVKVPSQLDPLLQGEPYVLISSAEHSPKEAAGDLAEAVGAGLTLGITHTRFPQPGQLKGTLGAQLENGYLFFSHAELRAFWAEEADEALSETDSLLAADEEGLEHLQVGKGGADMGFFGSLGHTKAAKPGGKSALNQSRASESQEVPKAGSQEAGTHASDDGNTEDRGRWGEQEQAPQHGQAPDEAAGSQAEEDTEQRGRWGQDPDIDHVKAAAKSGGPPEPVALPLDVRVDRGEWRARNSLTDAAASGAAAPPVPAGLPPHLGERLQIGSVPNLHAAAVQGDDQNGMPSCASSKHASPGHTLPVPAPDASRRVSPERKWSAEWPALSRKDDKSSRRGGVADRSRQMERDRSERSRSASRQPAERARSSDRGRSRGRLEKATLGSFMGDRSRAGRERGEQHPSLGAKPGSSQRDSPRRRDGHCTRPARVDDESKDSNLQRMHKSSSPPVNEADLPPHLRR